MNYCSRNARLLEKVTALLAKRIVLVVRCSALTAEESFALRRKMWDLNANFTLVKNSIARIAVVNSGFAFLSDGLRGPVAFAYCDGDVPSFLRLISQLSAEYGSQKFGVLSGKCDKQLFSQEQMSIISALPNESFVYADLTSVIMLAASSCFNMINAPANLLARYLLSYSNNDSSVSS